MTSVTRRAFTVGSAAMAAIATMPTPLAMAKAARQRSMLPTIARRRVGAVEVVAISDGFIEVPFDLFTGAPASEIEAAFAARAGHRPGRRHCLGFTVWLVDDGERLVLIDSGDAGFSGATTGRLPVVLDALGVRPDDIDAVLITHMHVDHIGGLVTDARPAFPNAEVFIHRDDVAHFTDPARAAVAPALVKTSFQVSMDAVAATPRLQRFDGERTLTGSIATVDLRGHTPGHTGYRIADGGETMLIVGDALFDPALHPARTEIGIAFEADPAAAAAMRQRLFPQAAEERALLAATHMPFPGFGVIVQEDGALRWEAADWDLAASHATP
jgi:glyoxylase-like metal-dependent hydrolase (beta-lactamase superfamily II)